MPLQLEPANPADVAVYQPYYAVGRRPFLPLAVGLYKRGNFEGQRPIEGEAAIPFIASWMQSPLPSDLTVCTVQFNQDADLSFDLSIPNYEFVDVLIEVVGQVQRGLEPDFNNTFYKKLMRRDE
jgi:hypothetical protein